jgi:methylase of polypeptide subunit release factors
MNDADRALAELGSALREHGYRFVTITPESHRRVLRRDDRQGRTLRDVFGWNRPFAAESVPAPLLGLAFRAGVIEQESSQLRASVRFSNIGEKLFVHSAYPTTATNAVFFGPDTYRFCSFLRRSFSSCTRLVDVGCGSGAGGLVAATYAERIVLADVNALALRFASVNATLSGTSVELAESDVLSSVAGRIDAVISNPPYLRDSSHRTYRDGGGTWGEGLSLRIAREALDRLDRGGKLYLYTGAPIVDGVDVLREELLALCSNTGASLTYEELDPDVFGSELEDPAYADVERIAAVGAVITRT